MRPSVITRPMRGKILLARAPKAACEGACAPRKTRDACATLAVWAVRRALPVRPVLVAQRRRVHHRRKARHPPELPVDRAQRMNLDDWPALCAKRQFVRP